MDYQAYEACADGTTVLGVRNFSIGDILNCGQCFRWAQTGDTAFRGIALDRECTVTQQGDTLLFHRIEPEEFRALWHSYFDFDRDYAALKTLLRADPVMARAVAFSPGMRVLRQQPWETLCSFIISANNNIPRIKGIVERLCGLFGQPVGDGFAFPAPERIATLTEDDLSPIRCGYRARYLLDAARQVAEGQLDLASLYTLPLEQARSSLRQVCGVGAKVAECVLLYGFARAECIPVDVWIKRALDQLYPGGLPREILPVAGLGQQYLFHFVRNCPEALALSAEKR